MAYDKCNLELDSSIGASCASKHWCSCFSVRPSIPFRSTDISK